jgi:predicted NUDIX family NTP pyrophosphohydrolase
MKIKKQTNWSIHKGDYQRKKTSEKSFRYKRETKEKITTIILIIILLALIVFAFLFI